MKLAIPSMKGKAVERLFTRVANKELRWETGCTIHKPVKGER